MKFRVFEMFDYILLICVFLLILMGILFVYSSGVNSEQVSVSNEYIKQIIFACTGLPIMIFFAVFDYRRIERFVLPAFLPCLLFCCIPCFSADSLTVRAAGSVSAASAFSLPNSVKSFILCFLPAIWNARKILRLLKGF